MFERFDAVKNDDFGYIFVLTKDLFFVDGILKKNELVLGNKFKNKSKNRSLTKFIRLSTLEPVMLSQIQMEYLTVVLTP